MDKIIEPVLPIPDHWPNRDDLNKALEVAKSFLVPQDPYEAAGKMVEKARAGDYLGAAQEGMAALPQQGMFAGRNAKTADLAKLATAEKMAAEGAERRAIWDATGWFQGADGKWRFEIPDNASAFHHLRMPKEPDRWEIAKQYFESQGVPATKIATGQYPLLDQEAFQYADHQIARGIKPEAPMSTLLEHPQFYDAYSEAGSLPVSAETNRTRNGSFDPAKKAVTIARERSLMDRPSEVARRQHSTALHELQHYIQSQEGFAPGANVQQFEGMYDHVPDAQVIRTLMNKRGLPVSDAIREFEGLVGRPASMQSKDLASSVTKDVFKMPASAEQAYKRTSGEVEARNVQSRMAMTPEERAARPPWETQDIPDDQQIVQHRASGGHVPLRLPLDSDDPNDVMRRAITYAFAISRMYKADGGPVEGDHNEPTMRAYEPTWRDTLASVLMGDEKASPERRNFVSGLMGSAGLGSTGPGVVDFTPAGGVLGAQESAQHGDPKGMAMAVLPMPAKAAKGIIAYHGSPHSFDRFDLSKIGTGEGAQAYGHGLYFADNEAVAKSYRDMLSQNRLELPNGRVIDPDWSDPTFNVVKALRENNGDWEAAKAALKELSPQDWANEAMAKANEYHASGAKLPPNGSMYQVRINADPEHFLDWDRPLSEHPEIVRRKLGWTPEAEAQFHSVQYADDDALLAALEGSGSYAQSRIPVPAGLPPLSATGEDIVRGRSVFDRASDIEKANRLREAGIPGLKYLDQGSRAAGEGSRNYVVFDDNLIDILRKYAKGGEVGGILEDRYPSHYMPGVGRQVMADGGAPSYSAPITGQHTITLDDLIGRAPGPASQMGAYTDAGGQKIASPFVTSTAGGYPVYSPVTPAKADATDPMSRFGKIFGRRGYDEGGPVNDVENALRVAREAQDREAMSHPVGMSGKVEFAPVRLREPLTGYEVPLGSIPKESAPAANAMLDTAERFAPYAFGPLAGSAYDMAVGAKEGSMADVATGALGLPGKGLKAAGILGSTLVGSDAEAGPIAKALKAIRATKLPMDEASRLKRAEELGFTGPWYHGSERTDRLVGSGKIDPRRATSGPMPYFTDSPELASKYAEGKPDTSLIAANTGDVANYFTVNPKDLGWSGRTPIPVERTWPFLPADTKQKILENYGRVGFENQDDFTGPLRLHGDFAGLSSPDHYADTLRREAKGNPLAALRNIWFEGGQLVNDPGQLEEVFQLAGYPYPISQANAPWTEAKGVMPAMLRMQRPLDTSRGDEIMQRVVPFLEDFFARDRSRKAAYGADMWDKNYRFTPREWTQQLKNDTDAGRTSFVFTSIPDKVTNALRQLDYDSILDVGGKMGGELHNVAIPFDPNQVRSRFAVFDPKHVDSSDLLKADGGSVINRALGVVSEAMPKSKAA